MIPKLHFLQRFVRKRKEYRTRSTQQRFAAALRNRRRKTLGKHDKPFLVERLILTGGHNIGILVDNACAVQTQVFEKLEL